MADKNGNSFIDHAFPPGSTEIFVKAGTLLGYQGDYSGSPANPVGVHLHFSIVKNGSDGRFLNELEIKNTLDPSPYFNLPLNGKLNKKIVAVCGNQALPN
jgi:murein DD-endopeptidase MepM/ murein hydrolase activator NlpD